jgi:hypothetical protein
MIIVNKNLLSEIIPFLPIVGAANQLSSHEVFTHRKSTRHKNILRLLNIFFNLVSHKVGKFR